MGTRMEEHGLLRYVPISPNYISTDLFSPCQRNRSTIPTIGFHAVKAPVPGENSWGEPITHYGGIGKLPFQGQTRVRDLHVSRSHRHYGSGFTKYQTSVQPTRVTSLLQSACRPNDQVLPKPFDTPLDPGIKLKDPPTDGQPYTSHVPIFEVFPRQDADRMNAIGDYPLSRTTRMALKNYEAMLYNTSKYQTTYKDHTEHIKTLVRDKALEKIREERKRQAKILDKYKRMNDRDEEENICDDEIVTDDKESGPTLKSILIKKHFCPIHDATPPKEGTPIPEKYGVTPCWPPSLSYTIDLRTAKLIEIDLPKPPPALKSAYKPECNCKPLTAMKSVTFDGGDGITDTPMPLKPTRAPTPYKTAECIHPTKVNSQGKIHKGICLKSSEAKPTNNVTPTETKSTVFNDVHLPEPLPHSTTPTFNDIKTMPIQIEELNGIKLPVPIDYYVSLGDARTRVLPVLSSGVARMRPETNRIKTRIVDKLGVRFKSDAHKRYHSMHPEPLKDLRDARKDGKCYFFHNYHASAFRGPPLQ